MPRLDPGEQKILPQTQFNDIPYVPADLDIGISQLTQAFNGVTGNRCHVRCSKGPPRAAQGRRHGENED